MSIEIAGYHPEVPGQIYTTEITVPTSKGEVQLLEMLSVHRFTVPTKEGISAYLREKADSLQGASKLLLGPQGQALARDRSPLERALLDLPPEYLGLIARGEEELMKNIEKVTPANSAQQGRKDYLSLSKGYFPSSFIGQNKEKGFVKGSWWYRAALLLPQLLKQGLAQQWEMLIRISPEGLPPRAEMDVLLKHGTRLSETFRITEALEKEELGKWIDFLYHTAPTPELLAELYDTSDEVRERISIIPVVTLQESLQEAAAMQQAMSDPRFLQVLKGQSRR